MFKLKRMITKSHICLDRILTNNDMFSYTCTYIVQKEDTPLLPEFKVKASFIKRLFYHFTQLK